MFPLVVKTKYTDTLIKLMLCFALLCCSPDSVSENLCPGIRITLHGAILTAKLPTYTSPKPTLTLTSHLGQNVGLGEG